MEMSLKRFEIVWTKANVESQRLQGVRFANLRPLRRDVMRFLDAVVDERIKWRSRN